MDLWIRSQDKTILINVKNLLIDDNDNSIYTVETLDIGTHTASLGKYKSKERTLEVLDEIQNIIRGKYIVNIDFNSAFSKGFTPKEVEEMLMKMALYEMPRE